MNSGCIKMFGVLATALWTTATAAAQDAAAPRTVPSPGAAARAAVPAEPERELVMLAPDEEERDLGAPLYSRYGIALLAGGGVEDFASDAMTETTDVGGNWDVRLAVGTKSPVAVEAAYTGSARQIDALFTQEDATLVGTGLEGNLRLNLLPLEQVTPYAFGGLGWRRYDVVGEDFTRASAGIADQDDLMELPFGGGISGSYRGFIVDARFTYRAAVGEDLVVDDDGAVLGNFDSSDGDLGLDTWSVSARMGVEF
jgi:hypothetical protein